MAPLGNVPRPAHRKGYATGCAVSRIYFDYGRKWRGAGGNPMSPILINGLRLDMRQIPGSTVHAETDSDGLGGT
jgi:hypothetical protein